MLTTRASKPRAAIYPLNDQVLFIPTEDMWNIHEASKLSAICARAGVGRVDRQIKKLCGEMPWFEDWLYSNRALPIESSEIKFRPTPAMLAFRKEATIRAILAAAPRSKDRMQSAWRRDYRPLVKDSLLSHWQMLYKAYDWFNPWLLRGKKPPSHVTVVTAQQARRCSHAWDFATFCRRAGFRSDSTYVLWLGRHLIPDTRWLRWLFGAPAPAGAIVVGHELQRLRKEMSRKGVLRAACMSTATIWYWEQRQRTSGVIKALLAGENWKNMKEWEQLTPETQDQMEAVNKAGSLAACCNRAGLSVSAYYNALREAERYDVKDELLQFLKSESKYRPPRSRQSGLVAKDIFIPTRDMLRFRDEAIREGVKQKIWSLAALPGFHTWFLDWATPKSYRGRRHLVTVQSVLAIGAKRNKIPNSKPQRHKGQHGTMPKNGQSPIKKGGRPTDERTQELHRFCWEARQRGEKRTITMLKANERFKRTVVREVAHVTTYASRYKLRQLDSLNTQ
ncbi:MAG: hypothetical protein ACJ8FY_09970 [Gemmataceae bacterium]